MANVITQFTLVNVAEDTSIAANVSAVSVTADITTNSQIIAQSPFTANGITFRGQTYCGYFKQVKQRGGATAGRFNIVRAYGEQGFFLPTGAVNYAF